MCLTVLSSEIFTLKYVIDSSCLSDLFPRVTHESFSAITNTLSERIEWPIFLTMVQKKNN